MLVVMVVVLEPSSTLVYLLGSLAAAVAAAGVEAVVEPLSSETRVYYFPLLVSHHFAVAFVAAYVAPRQADPVSPESHLAIFGPTFGHCHALTLTGDSSQSRELQLTRASTVDCT